MTKHWRGLLFAFVLHRLVVGKPQLVPFWVFT